jgi:MoaA/NifB/PqqE/SkfB family radical SAM enzyme
MKLTLKVTERCMGRCPGCTARASWSQARRTEPDTAWDIDVNFAKDVVRQASLIGFDKLVLSGGEPTIYPHLSELVLFATSHGFQVKLNTNGWNMTSLLRELCESKLSSVSLSLYSLDRDVYLALRGQKDMYRRAMLAVKCFGRHVPSTTNACSMVLQTIITSRNFLELPDIVELAMDHGFSAVATSYLEDAYRHPELRLSTSEIKFFRADVVPRLQRLIQSYPLSQSARERNMKTLATYFDPKTNSDENWAQGIYRPIAGSSCDQPGDCLLVYADGLAAPCCGFEYWQTPEFMEELRYRNILSIMQGAKFTRFAKERIAFCRYCPIGMHPWLYLSTERESEAVQQGREHSSHPGRPELH